MGEWRLSRCKYPVLLSSHDFLASVFRVFITNRLLSFCPSQHLPSVRRRTWGAGLQASGSSPDVPQCMEVTVKDSQGEKNKCKTGRKSFPTSYNSSKTQESFWLMIKEPTQLEPNRREYQGKGWNRTLSTSVPPGLLAKYLHEGLYLGWFSGNQSLFSELPH